MSWNRSEITVLFQSMRWLSIASEYSHTRTMPHVGHPPCCKGWIHICVLITTTMTCPQGGKCGETELLIGSLCSRTADYTTHALAATPLNWVRSQSLKLSPWNCQVA